MIALLLVAASLRVVPSQVELTGAGASQQFVAIATDETGAELDVTSEAVWSVEGGRLLVRYQYFRQLVPTKEVIA